jgi:hypothetical protein
VKPIAVQKFDDHIDLDEALGETIAQVGKHGECIVIRLASGKWIGLVVDGNDDGDGSIEDTNWPEAHALLRAGVITEQEFTAEMERQRKEREARERQEYERLKRKFEGGAQQG